MNSKILTTLLLLISITGFSQQLTYKGNGNVYNSENERIRPSEMRKLLESKPGFLTFYNEGRAQKTAGNILLLGGAGLVVGDILIGATADVTYPGTLTYLGLASMIVAIPVKVGFSKKIRTVVDEYNKQVADADKLKIEKIAICANGNGIGLQLTF